MLAATDVVARGLDIEAIERVVNFDIAHDPEIHLHRIGVLETQAFPSVDNLDKSTEGNHGHTAY